MDGDGDGEGIPVEILRSIFSFLPLSGLASARLVCKRWSWIGLDHTFWPVLRDHRFVSAEFHRACAERNWLGIAVLLKTRGYILRCSALDSLSNDFASLPAASDVRERVLECMLEGADSSLLEMPINSFYHHHPLHTAIESKNWDVLSLLVALGADLNAETHVAVPGSDAVSSRGNALHWVIRLHRKEREMVRHVLQWLLLNGADLHARSQCPVLHTAVRYLHHEDTHVLAMLLDAGLDPREVDCEGRTIYDALARRNIGFPSPNVDRDAESFFLFLHTRYPRILAELSRKEISNPPGGHLCSIENIEVLVPLLKTFGTAVSVSDAGRKTSFLLNLRNVTRVPGAVHTKLLEHPQAREALQVWHEVEYESHRGRKNEWDEFLAHHYTCKCSVT